MTTPEQLSDRYIQIWREVFGREPTADMRVSEAEKELYKRFLLGIDTEDRVRSLLYKIKVFQTGKL